MEYQWRNRIYDNYVTNVFHEAHEMKKEMEIQYRYFKKNYLKYIPDDHEIRILELGCGMGQFLNFVIKSGYTNYEGIELSAENIEFIKNNVDSSVQIHKMDMFQFLKESEAEIYDVVIFNDVIEHLTKSEIFEVLDGIWRVLKKGGRLLVKTPNMANPYVNTAGRYIVIDHEIGFTETSMREVLRACNYSKISIVGTDIYVINPILNVVAKCLSKVVSFRLYILSVLFGRRTCKIFEKDILAIAEK